MDLTEAVAARAARAAHYRALGVAEGAGLPGEMVVAATNPPGLGPLRTAWLRAAPGAATGVAHTGRVARRAVTRTVDQPAASTSARPLLPLGLGLRVALDGAVHPSGRRFTTRSAGHA
jgi:hypothetical protein